MIATTVIHQNHAVDEEKRSTVSEGRGGAIASGGEIRKTKSAWSRWQQAKNDLLYRAAETAFWLVGLLPLGLSLALGSVLGWLGFVAAGSERRKALASLALAFPELSETERRRIACRCFRNLGRSAAEVCCLRRLDVASYVEPAEGTRARIDHALSQGKGLIWVTAHLGNWELLAAGLSAHGYDVRPVATQSYDPRFTDMIDRWRRRQGVRTLWRGRQGLAEGVSEALSSGAILGLLIDQDTRTRGAFVPFFGKTAWTPTGAAELSRQSGAPALAGFIRQKTGGGHQIEAVELPLHSGGEPEETDRLNTAKLTEAIETAIRQRPADWVWMHQRWRTRPEGGES